MVKYELFITHYERLQHLVACRPSQGEVPMIQRVPTAKYFIIRLHIGVKWSFDVYNTRQGSGGPARAVHPREMLYVTGGRTCRAAVFANYGVSAPPMLFVKCYTLTFVFSSICFAFV